MELPAAIHAPSIGPGTKLDRYEMVCPIAQGGMASVWIARLTGGHGFEKLVAIKTILPKLAADARFQEMFVEEARIASRIDHLNVAQILDVGEQDRVTYLVMEYVDGDSLSTMHRAAQRVGALLPPGIVLRIMADACGGLHAAHELRNAEGSLLSVVHRDVSPQNILVSARGMAKLIDFGIAKVRDRLADDVTTGPLKGKARYMAPEQARGEIVDRRADVWAVGAVLYHLLSGRPAYDGSNDVETLVRLQSAEAPEALASDVHSAVASVVMRALSPRLDDRFASASELQQAIETAMVEARLETTDAKVASFLATRDPGGAPATKRKAMIARGLRVLSELQSPDPEETPIRALPVPSPPNGAGHSTRPAAVSVDVDLPPLAAPRPPWMFAVAVACVLAGAAGVAVFARSHARRGVTTAAQPAPASATSAAAVTDSRGPSEPRPVTGTELRVPTVNVTQLPLASGVASATAPVVAAPPARPPPAPRPPKPPARVRIDDGF